MDPSISLLEVHKLMYFLQAAGEPLRLRYQKAWYGPYAENLRHVLDEVEGHYISGYDSEGDAPATELSLLPGAASTAEELLASNAKTHERFERVAQLVDGYETPFGLELLSTVHWVATREGASDSQRIAATTRDWGHRKKQFTTAQIELAVDHLRAQDWLDVPMATPS
jgi:hypothetical protein